MRNMMQDNDVRLEAVIPALRAGNKKQVLAALAEEMAKITGHSARIIGAQLAAQEKRASSGIGDGVAIAHATLRGLAAPRMIFARLNQPVDFDAVDGQPVSLALLLLSPEKDGPVHLRRLARVTRMMRDETLRRHLRGTEDADALRAFLTDPQTVQLAA